MWCPHCESADTRERREFAKLLGAKALFGCFVTLPVTKIIIFLRKIDSHLW